MNLRSAAVDFALIGKLLDDGFLPLRLPTNKDVLRKFFCYFKTKKFAEQKSINHTVIELIDIWKKVSGAAVPECNCFQSVKTVKKKFNKLIGQYRLAVRAGENPSTKAPIQHKESFGTIQDDLFDISKSDIKQKLCVEDYNFIVDQQGDRKFTVGNTDKNLQRRLLRKRSREDAEQQRKMLSNKFSIDDVQFLRRAHNQWFKYDSFKRLEQLVMNMKVTNDTAERGIKILEDYKDVLTTDNEQRNVILHCVENIRKNIQILRKKEKKLLIILLLTTYFLDVYEMPLLYTNIILV